MLSDSFEYTKEAVMEKWVKWILLIIPFMTQGYSIQVFKGVKPAPEVNDWVATFIDGIKLVLVGIIYFIPIIIIGLLFMLPLIIAGLTGKYSAIMAGVGAAFLGLLICIILGIIVYILLPIAYIRFARTGSFGDAFNFNAILAHIGKIGWGAYIISMIVLVIAAFVFGIVLAIVSFILMLIPVLGWLLFFIIELILMPPVGIFVARYFTQVYDSVAA